MENYSYSSYPDSVNSSPRSREIDCENSAWDDQQPPPNYKVKFMCSYGGKILPRPHDNQLAYVAGETKILSVDRNIRFSNLVAKLSSLSDCDVCFKYQLPGEDLDALISVTNDEDLEHMMLEYDRIYRGSVKPTRLRLFLFPLSTPATSTFGSTDSKNESQWFVDALNSVQLQNLDVNSPKSVSSVPTATAAPVNNPDFLFGLDKGEGQQNQAVKLHDPTPPPPAPQPVVPEVFHAGGSDAGSEDRHAIGDSVISPMEYQRQIHEMQRLQQQQQQQLPRVYSGEYYQQKAPPQPQAGAAVPVTNPGTFWPPERHMTSGPYPATAVQTDQQPVYIVQTPGGPAGVYQTPAGIRPVTSQVGGPQAYYGMQRVVQEVYREHPVYGGVPPQPTIQPPKMGGAYTSENMGVRQHAPHAPVEPTYTQVGYDGVGRQVYYTAPPGVMQQQMQHPAMAVDGRQSGGALNPEGRNVGKP